MKKILAITLIMSSVLSQAQSVTKYTTTEESVWQKGKASLSSKPAGDIVLNIEGKEDGVVFQGWGTTFNELDLDALNLLAPAEQEEIMRNLYSPEGDLHFTLARVSMNANDYARAWYSCDSVDGDFGLEHFNIEHDKANILKLAKMALKYCPELELFMSPWSPPAWMKINHEYSVQSSRYNVQDPRKDYLLFANEIAKGDEYLMGPRQGVYPPRLATQDFFIQDPRYLQAYADMFCRFIDLYAQEGIRITKVMYQNEAYSYTIYPGCAWTAEGTLRFNNDYLAPTLKKYHPEVDLWIGTFNTNRLDYVQKILDDKTLQSNIKGMGTQWECRDNLPALRERYPNLRFMVSESECGNGDMDWKAAEHTFLLLADNTGNGCDEYYNWNFCLADNGSSTWGWTQNGLIQVDSKTRKMRYTAEYYAYKHFSHFIAPGAKMVGYAGREHSDTPLVVFQNEKEYIVVCGNFTEGESSMTVKLGGKYLNIATRPHSFTTYIVKKK